MKKPDFVSKLLLMVVTISSAFLLGGCDKDPQTLQQNGYFYFKDKDYLASTTSYLFLLEKQPDNPNGHYGLGLNYSAVGAYEEAITEFNKAIEAVKTNATYRTYLPSFYFELAKTYTNNSDYTEAGNALKKANEINPGLCISNDSYLFTCTKIYDYAGMISSAIDLHNRYPYAESHLSRKNRILSYLEIRNHDYDAAIKHAAKSIELYPQNELGYYAIAMASGGKGQYAKAIDAFRKGIQIKDHGAVSIKKYLPYYMSLGYYLAKNGDYDEALAAYNDAIRNTKQLSYRYSYTKQVYSSASGRYVPTTAWATGYVNYNDYPSQRALAYAYYNTGRYDEALGILNSQIAELEIGKIGIVALKPYALTATMTSTFDLNKHIMLVKPGSPAEKAGLKFWDIVSKVDGKGVKRKSTEKFVNMVSGPVGSEVTLKIKRYEDPEHKKGKTVFEQKVLREHILNQNMRNKLARAYGLRSLIYRAKGDTDNAFADAEKAMNYNPDFFDAKLAWALVNNDSGYYKKALKILSNLSQPESEMLYSFDVNYFMTPLACQDELVKLGKANAYFKLGKVNSAIDYLPQNQFANALPPLKKEFEALSGELTQLAQSHNTKAVSLHKKGFLKEAMKEYTVALKYTSSEKQEKEIRNNYINLIKEYPVSQEMSDEARKYLVRGELLFKQGDMAGALRESLKGLKIAPYSSKFYFNVAELNGGLKNYDKAIEYMKIYIKLAPKATDIQKAKDDITRWELMQERK